MPDDFLSMVVTGESGFFEHLAEDEVSVLAKNVRERSAGAVGVSLKPCCPW